jgi:hypothetical protein
MLRETLIKHWHLENEILSKGLFIIPFASSDVCSTVAGMVMPKRNISIGRESLKYFLCPMRRGVLADFTARGPSWRNMAWTCNKKAFCVLEFAKTEWIVTRQRRCRTTTTQKRTGSHSTGISCTTHELICPWVVLCGTWSETSVAPSQLIQFCQIPRHRTLSYSLSKPCFITTAP